MKRQGWMLPAVLFLAMLVSLPAAGAVRGGTTLVIAPARYSVLQVCFDLVQRHGVVLVSYRGDATTEKPLLHVWDGQEWKYVALPDFQSGAFVDPKPAQTVVIGDASLVPAAAFAPLSAWAGQTINIPSLYTDEIVNRMSKLLKFTAADWAWWSARYRMQLEDANAAVRSSSMYDHQIATPINLKLKIKHPAKTPESEVPPARMELPAPKAVEPPAPKLEIKPLKVSTEPAAPNKAEAAAPSEEPVSGLSLRLKAPPVEEKPTPPPAN